MKNADKKPIPILGGGFAGAYSALRLEKQLGGAAEIPGVNFSGIVAWRIVRGIYPSKLPGARRKVRAALDRMLGLFFSNDIVQPPTLRCPTLPTAQETYAMRVPPAGPKKSPS